MNAALLALLEAAIDAAPSLLKDLVDLFAKKAAQYPSVLASVDAQTGANAAKLMASAGPAGK